ncbi:hypothetical protein B5X24_HaOG206069 [Helicoverpa armigera]|uniref:Uncharacterized protein n=1 Tax=Helicoverpa armigera TaxID=29058 RepID=A0A2W1BRP9_HELAM|nr:hypothetical protein B5X24_HaOG206069 [Helicoverpa armigera]
MKAHGLGFVQGHLQAQQLDPLDDRRNPARHYLGRLLVRPPLCQNQRVVSVADHADAAREVGAQHLVVADVPQERPRTDPCGTPHDISRRAKSYLKDR